MAEEQKKDNPIKKEESAAHDMGEPRSTEVERELEKCQREREEYLNGWKRAKADLINYQKDEAKRFEEVMQYATEAMVRDLIPVLDSFELGISALEKNGPVDKGVYIIKTQLEEALKKKGLEKIKVSVGDAFDPVKHESIGEVTAAGVESGKVGEVIESGYILNGKIVRPARVKIVK